MNTWPGPENSWEGVDAYFTWADSPGMLIFLALVVGVICLGVIAKMAGFQAAQELRINGIKVERDYEMGSMKSQMRKANKSNCRLTLIIGESEIKSGKYILKNMSNSEQQEVKANNLSSEIEKKLNK